MNRLNLNDGLLNVFSEDVWFHHHLLCISVCACEQAYDTGGIPCKLSDPQATSLSVSFVRIFNYSCL